MKILDGIRGLLEKDSSVKRVAEDLHLTSELILLVRMIFADGEMKPEELQNFKRICKIAFDIPENDVPEVVKYLQDYGYETTAGDAAAMFSSLDEERKKSLLLHLMSIAKADNVVHEGEVDMIRKVAEILGVSGEDLARFRASS
ncbi:MAG: TerB family tellurite resistance protein [Rhizobiaceae bacterium]|nr:TerB family tellurite resistance protein [Rhizobiaceae bacterium]